MTSWVHAWFQSSPTLLSQCGLCVDVRADVGCAKELLSSGPHLMSLGKVQPWAAFPCAQHASWVCGKAGRALAGALGWTCSSACLSGFASGI